MKPKKNSSNIENIQLSETHMETKAETINKTEDSKTPTKKLVFIAQNKGGVGKSVLMFLFAEKYKDALIVDLDHDTKPTSRHLAYRSPKAVNFLTGKTQNIDRSVLNEFIETVSQLDEEVVLCDLGGAISG